MPTIASTIKRINQSGARISSAHSGTSDSLQSVLIASGHVDWHTECLAQRRSRAEELAMTIDVLRDVTHVMESLSPEQNQLLDRWSDQLQGLVQVGIEQGGPAARRMKNWLNGVWLGHPLHPALTDVVLGAWSTGFLLDAVGARGAADAAITVGVLSAVPTA